MKIHFYVRFHTNPGQTLQININQNFSAIQGKEETVPMMFYNDQLWHHRLDLPEDAASVPESIQYKYILKQDNGETIVEWGGDRVIDLSKITAEEIQTIDTWNHSGEYENAFYSAP